MEIHPGIVFEPILPVVSNMGFIIPIFYLTTYRYYTEMISFLMVMIWSSLYHMCFDMRKCVLDRDTLQVMDFFSSYFSISCICIHFLDLKSVRKKSILYILFAVVNLLTVQIDRFNVFLNILPMLFLIPVILFRQIILFLMYLCVRRDREIEEPGITFEKDSPILRYASYLIRKRKKYYHPNEIVYRGSGLVIFVVAYIINSLHSESKYRIAHSSWHVFISLSIPLLFYQKDRKTIFSSEHI